MINYSKLGVSGPMKNVGEVLFVIEYVISTALGSRDYLIGSILFVIFVETYGNFPIMHLYFFVI